MLVTGLVCGSVRVSFIQAGGGGRKGRTTEEQAKGSAEQILRQLAQLPHPIALFDDEGQLTFYTNTFRAENPAIALSGHAGVSLRDLIAARSPQNISGAEEDRYIQKQLDKVAQINGYLRDEETTRGWMRRFRHRLRDGYSAFVGMSVDSLVKERDALLRERSKLTHEAYHDQLTSLPNRRGLNAAMRELLTTDGKARQRMALLHVDLDRFKAINDTLGHQIGDIVLARAADILRGAVRASDLVARIGGDEFLLILSRFRSTEDVENIALRIIERMGEPIELDGEQCQVGASVGIAQIEPDCSAHGVLENADIALYIAKERGRGRHCVYEPGMRTSYRQEQARIQVISEAVRMRAFEPWFAPVRKVDTSEMIGLEVFPHWMHIEKGPLDDTHFAQWLRRGGLSRELDGQIVEATLRQIADWQAEGLPVPRIGMVLSAESLADFPFLNQILQQMELLRISTDQLAIGVREQDVQGPLIIDALKCLREAGLRRYLTGFGTGSTSIPALRTLDVTQIRLDPVLWGDASRDPALCSVIEAIATMANGHDICLAATGVATAGDCEILGRLGVGAIIGPFAGRAAPAERISAYFTEE